MTNSEQSLSQYSREAFEKGCQLPAEGNCRLSIERCVAPFDEDEYQDTRTQIAWAAWQAAIAWHQADLVARLEALRFGHVGMAYDVLDKAIAIVRGGKHE